MFKETVSSIFTISWYFWAWIRFVWCEGIYRWWLRDLPGSPFNNKMDISAAETSAYPALWTRERTSVWNKELTQEVAAWVCCSAVLLHIFTHSSLCLSLSFFCLAPSPLPFDKPPLLPSHPSESCHSNRPYAHPYLHYCPNGFTCYQPHALVWIGIIWGTMGKLEARGPHRTRLSILCGPPEKSIIESLYHILLDGWYAVV